MVEPSDEDAPAAVATARTAYEGGEWEEVCARYAEAEAAGHPLSPDDLERLASAELFTNGGSEPTGFERAFAAYEKAGRVHDAARVAVYLGSIYAVRGSPPLAMGWGRRAERILEGREEGAGHAHVAGFFGLLATFQGKINDALTLAERSHALAREYAEPDAEATALNRRARLLLRLGRIDEAKADLDEAMLLVHQGRVRPMPAAMIYCNTIDVCRDMSDFERAMEWTEAAATWIDQRRVWCFPGICRIHRAELLRMRGEHDRAAVEIQNAIEMFEQTRARGVVGEALAERGLQRLEVGDLDGAEEAFHAAQEAGHLALPGAALLRLRRGDPAGARSLLEGGLDERAENPLGRAVLLPALVEACLATGDIDAARDAAEELQRTAELMGTVGLQASASAARARVHLAQGDARPALVQARAAARAWNLVGARYQVCRSRELLAEAYRKAGDPTRAAIEEASAKSERDALGSSSGRPSPDPAETRTADARPATFESTPTVTAGTTIDDKIEVGEVLGVGGMGVVHAGRHRLTGREIAIKVLKGTACGDAKSCERFLQEALACGRIRHPNVVDIYDAGWFGREPYIVMERLSGEPLNDRIGREPALSVAEALTIAEQAARGVAAAHAAGIVHRDLKPANIFVDTAAGPTVKVLDFGLSKLADAGLSRTGQILGTPFYMAPEQIDTPAEVDERTDVYALGAVLFEMLTGRPPFVADNLTGLLVQITVGDPPDLARERPDLPPAIIDLTHRALARDRSARWPSAATFADAVAAAG